MKTIGLIRLYGTGPVLAILIILSGFDAVKAQIPNPGFEYWDTTQGIAIPNGYWTSCLSNMNQKWVAPDTDCVEGLYSARIITDYYAPGNPLIYRGVLLSDTYDSINGTWKNGYPFQNRPQSLNGFAKFSSPASTYCGFIVCSLSRWNFTSQERENIATSTQTIFPTNGNWISFSLQLNYLSPFFPDTCLIAAMSAPPGCQAPVSVMLVDSLYFTGFVTGITAQPVHDGISTFPNPAGDYVHVFSEYTIPGPVEVQICGMDGRILQSFHIGSIPGQTSIKCGLPGFSPGIYMLRLNSRTFSKSRKIVIQ